MCAGPLGLGGARGRLPAYCSSACRGRAWREHQGFPVELTAGRRWVRAEGKRPVMVDGRPASSTDPRTWSSFAEVRGSAVGDGMGVMLGGGLGCYDLDHVSDAQARAFIATVSERVVYAERSMSGSGVHVFVVATEARGWKRRVDGLSVERYSRERFIRVTGSRFF